MPQRTYSKDFPLTELNRRVNDTEQALGKSTDVACLPDSTGVTFDGGPPPATLVLIQRAPLPKPPGSTKIYSGTAWDAGAPDVDVIAYRMP
jgi:hypothetical protein